MIWFTSDTHFGHAKVLSFHPLTRPYQTIEEMDEAYIHMWNGWVGEDDTVYHLGDFAFRGHSYYASRLKGRIVLIEGSHDRMSIADRQRFTWAGPRHIVKGNPDIILSHYAMRVWPRSHYGTWHLFGHSHGSLPPHGKSFDVGWDLWGGPISIEVVKTEMAKLTGEKLTDPRYWEGPRPPSTPSDSTGSAS